ncbi:sigma-70 family RNA polymerase sigma factor [Amycolatopsis sp. 195334CR]|uniref:sigma-70 family RNA polymerase sigma factor n=1 Tax=Amycolatopsis sp. 195334CR TaxID=2814588 RepID=UPI001A90716C|nr:sigma-70 family RNA polymerase sigma factor [Amycolatopsis sp. 195334CR]MBN6033652.1 sigma-70 family RNA polymerase sigma factor [Amycolatopsis sp. 195334CR]
MWEREHGTRDEVLLAAVRDGDFGACDVLFRRHAAAAHRAAVRWSSDPAERDDLVAESFVRVLIAVRSGSGPKQDMWPYLLVTMRNLAVSWQRRQARVDLPGEVPERAAMDAAVDELTVRRWQAGIAWAAFCTLPGRWRTVLWHTEVEGASAAELAPMLGVSANGVAGLAMRAREGLRRAYLQVQVPDSSKPDCGTIRPEMAAWVRDGLSVRRAAKVAAHVERCRACRAVAAGLFEANLELRPSLARRNASALVMPISAGMTGGGKVAAVVAAAVVAVTGAPVPQQVGPVLPGPRPEVVALPPSASAELPVTGTTRVIAGPRVPVDGEAVRPVVDLHPAEGSARGSAACAAEKCGNAKESSAAQSGGGNAWGAKQKKAHSKSGTKSPTSQADHPSNRGGKGKSRGKP